MAGEISIGTKSAGKITSDYTSYIKADVSKVGNANLAGITPLIKYTKGSETSITITQYGIFPAIGTDIYQMPSGLSGILAVATWDIVGSGNWQLPIAVQPYGQIYLGVTYTGATNGTTAIVADIIYDTETGV